MQGRREREWQRFHATEDAAARRPARQGDAAIISVRARGRRLTEQPRQEVSQRAQPGELRHDEDQDESTKRIDPDSAHAVGGDVLDNTQCDLPSGRGAILVCPRCETRKLGLPSLQEK